MGRNTAQAQKLCFYSRFDPKLDDWRIKSSPNLTKICRHNHKGLVNMSTEGIDESLHGLGGIEEFPSKNGVFSRTQKSPIEGTHDSGEFSTRLDGLEASQGVTKSSRNRSQSHAQRTKRKNQNSSHKRHSKYKIDSNSKASRAQGGEGLLSRSILVQSLKNPWMKFYPRERKREEQRREGGAPGREVFRKEKPPPCCCPPLPFNLLTSLAKG